MSQKASYYFHLKILLYLAILGENEVKYNPWSLFQHKKKKYWQKIN